MPLETELVTEKRGRGRPADPDAVLFLKEKQPELGARLSQRQWLSLWPGATQNAQLQEVFAWAMKMRPEGPEGFPHAGKGAAPRYRAPTSLTRYMARYGLTRTEALARIATEFKKLYPEEFE